MEREDAAKIVKLLVEDLKGRSGFDSTWGSLDVFTRNKLQLEWVRIVLENTPYNGPRVA